jgi:PTH1 family peptidyl-tRNA hydrolase
VKLVVGLGNPGRKYESTRHNAGYWWVERLAGSERAGFRYEARFHGEVAKIGTRSGDIWLLKPDTFMNQSGRAVAALAVFSPGEILIVHDELDLPPGTARFKKGGGTGGHNGVNDVATHLGTRDFWRLRLGIGHPRNQAASEQEVLDYVLRKPVAADRAAIDDAISRSLELWPLIAEDQLEAAMLKLHTRKSVNGAS